MARSTRISGNVLPDDGDKCAHTFPQEAKMTGSMMVGHEDLGTRRPFCMEPLRSAPASTAATPLKLIDTSRSSDEDMTDGCPFEVSKMSKNTLKDADHHGVPNIEPRFCIVVALWRNNFTFRGNHWPSSA